MSNDRFPKRSFMVLQVAIVSSLLMLAVGCPKDSEPTAPEVAKAEFVVKGMTCGNCEAAIKSTLEKLDGVDLVQADFTRGYASANYNPQITKPSELVEKINSLGFESRIRVEGDEDIAPSPHGVPEPKEDE